MYAAKRPIDVVISALGLCVLAPLLGCVACVIKITSRGPVIYWSNRVGANSQTFSMAKFRTMQVTTPQVATHLLEQPESYLTLVGGFLRRTSIDELPQLWNVFIGDMSLIGPRPALHNQCDLVEMRRSTGADLLRPGITGLAQVSGRDSLSISQKVALDARYLANCTIQADAEILWRTVRQVLVGTDVTH